MELLFATSNPSKVERFKKQLLKHNITIKSLKDINTVLDVEETGKDGIENALIKARAYYQELNIPIMAMDDNLYLDNVPENKQPGVFVRRINGQRLTDEELLSYYIDLVKAYGINNRINASWSYGLAIIKDDKEYTYSFKKDSFYLIDKPTNKRHPGYPLDSISINKETGKYFTDLTPEDKKDLYNDEADVISFIVKSIT